ncbi:MAG: hypothetical protein AAFY02_00540 [Pseudomonadota bacterium]
MTDDRQGTPAPGVITLWVIRLGALWVAAMALWRIALSLDASIQGLRLQVREAALTFMWIPDLLFCGLFLYLAFAAGRAGRQIYQETGLITAGLQIAFLVATTVVFRGWTDGAALGFTDYLTWCHVIVPSLWCAWFFLYLLWGLWRGRTLAPRR